MIAKRFFLDSFVLTSSTNRVIRLNSLGSRRWVSSHGDFAGYMATYDLQGKLIPLPDHYVPEVFREWGQVPPALEVITSENGKERVELRVLPEAGCGIDNLEVLKSSTFLDNYRVLWQDDGLSASIEAQSPHQVHLEACQWSGDSRLRVAVQAVENDKLFSLQPPINLYTERRFSTQSSHGTRSDGGGLDGRSVAAWIGDEIRSQMDSLSGDDIQQNDGAAITLPLGMEMEEMATNDEWKLRIGSLLFKYVDQDWIVERLDDPQ